MWIKSVRATSNKYLLLFLQYRFAEYKDMNIGGLY